MATFQHDLYVADTDRIYFEKNPQDHRPVFVDRHVKLKTTVNAWKRTSQSSNLDVPEDEKETIKIVRSVRLILNKLTPSNFKNLMQQVLSLKIDTEKRLRETIDLIFEKAINDPTYSEAYANMCRQMTFIRVTPAENPYQPNPDSQLEFRKLLLTKCQREFEKNKSDREHLIKLRKKMETNTDAELAPLLKEEYKTAEYKERRRTLGNTRFIGELFKLKMFTESIMHNCIMSLFKANDDDHLESLCCLLTTIGKDLDHAKAKQRMDQYFELIRKKIQEKRTFSRVRFRLQDVDDLRSNNWVPRSIQKQGPKTISQIHQDAKRQQEMLQLKLATTPTAAPMKQGNRGQNRMGSRGYVDDGWTKVPSTPKPTRFDPSKMKLMKPSNIDESTVTVESSKGYGGWKFGSAGSSIIGTGSSGYSPAGSIDKTKEVGERSNTLASMMKSSSSLPQQLQLIPQQLVLAHNCSVNMDEDGMQIKSKIIHEELLNIVDLKQNSQDHQSSKQSSKPLFVSMQKKVVPIHQGMELGKAVCSSANQETTGILTMMGDILNKLTPSTFKILMKQVLSLKIDTEKKLRGVVDLIFEKAIDEPNSAEAYANMCHRMTTIRVTPEESLDEPSPEGQVDLKKLLLTKCQQEFGKSKSDQEHLLEMQKKMDSNADTELELQLKVQYETTKYEESKRMLGNTIFFAKLFKVKMVTESIMHNCIVFLLNAKDDDHLECLCRLLLAVGKNLDHHKGKQKLDQYFAHIRKTIEEKSTSSRVRFMLRDVEYRRLKNWLSDQNAEEMP